MNHAYLQISNYSQNHHINLYNSHQILKIKVAEDCVKKSDMQLIIKEFKDDNRINFNELKDVMQRDRQELMAAIGKKQDRT